MVTMTLAVPDELRHKMETFPEINWSEVARQAFNLKISDLEFLRKFKSESKFTEEGALKLGAEVSRNLAKRFAQKRGN
ncbi:MAG: hypothetical protein Q7J54_00925 [Candidatus Woesearchaeota archaeon]|nr:hypothetical protein [Candidatus Woesearchaeota archaeon]